MAGGTGPSASLQHVDGAHLWRADDLGGLELLSATLTAFAFRPHAHEEYFIAVTEAGLAAPRIGGIRM